MLILQDCLAKLKAFKNSKGDLMGIQRIGIFGSVARQQNNDTSDLDVVVEMDKPTLRTMYELETNLKRMFGCKIDIVQMRPTLRPLLKQNIQREVIYV